MEMRGLFERGDLSILAIRDNRRQKTVSKATVNPLLSPAWGLFISRIETGDIFERRGGGVYLI